MTRSQEALERRAQKRNLSLDEMKDIDSSSIQKKYKMNTPRNEDRIENSDIKKKKDHKEISNKSMNNDRWVCSVCHNSNLCKISTLHCNRCQRLRSEVDPHANQIEKVVEESQSTKVQKSTKVQTRTSTTQKPQEKRKNKMKNKNEQSVWLCPPPTQEKIEENMRLRKLYEDPDSRSQLSSEELERARILVERSERKKQKKLARVSNSNGSG